MFSVKENVISFWQVDIKRLISEEDNVLKLDAQDLHKTVENDKINILK